MKDFCGLFSSWHSDDLCSPVLLSLWESLLSPYQGVSLLHISLYSPSLHLIISVHSGLLFTNDVQVHGLLEFSPCGFYLLLSFFGSFDFSQSYFLSFLDFDIQNLRKQYYRFIGLPLSLLLFGKAQRPLTSS